VGSCNGLRLHEAILDRLDHPKVLPLVVDAIGWNIQNRGSTFGYPTDPSILSLGWHFDAVLSKPRR
jgi:hypothetical protein